MRHPPYLLDAGGPIIAALFKPPEQCVRQFADLLVIDRDHVEVDAHQLDRDVVALGSASPFQPCRQRGAGRRGRQRVHARSCRGLFFNQAGFPVRSFDLLGRRLPLHLVDPACFHPLHRKEGSDEVQQGLLRKQPVTAEQHPRQDLGASAGIRPGVIDGCRDRSA